MKKYIFVFALLLSTPVLADDTHRDDDYCTRASGFCPSNTRDNADASYDRAKRSYPDSYVQDTRRKRP